MGTFQCGLNYMGAMSMQVRNVVAWLLLVSFSCYVPMHILALSIKIR